MLGGSRWDRPSQATSGSSHSSSSWSSVSEHTSRTRVSIPRSHATGLGTYARDPPRDAEMETAAEEAREPEGQRPVGLPDSDEGGKQRQRRTETKLN
eukprot:scaffold10_cov257-Pinguiococcus_pyrenoidosus.AAC.8